MKNSLKKAKTFAGGEREVPKFLEFLAEEAVNMAGVDDALISGGGEVMFFGKIQTISFSEHVHFSLIGTQDHIAKDRDA